MNDYSNIDRSMMVFRPKDQDFAKNLAQKASDNRNARINDFSVRKAFGALVTISGKDIEENTAEKEMSDSTFCSKFAIECIDRAAIGEYKKFNLNIRSSSTPKILESYLYNNDDYQPCIYTGKEPYIEMKTKIESELERLKVKGGSDPQSKNKYTLAKTYYDKVTAILDNDQQENSLDKTLYLLSAMLPSFAIRTQFDLGITPTKSYENIIYFARSMRIFTRDIQDTFKLDIDKSIKQQEEALSKIENPDYTVAPKNNYEI